MIEQRLQQIEESIQKQSDNVNKARHLAHHAELISNDGEGEDVELEQLTIVPRHHASNSTKCFIFT